MNAMIEFTSQPLTMSSREIAELCEKNHQHVMRDIKVMLEQLGESEGGYVQNWTHPQNGQMYPVFMLPKDLTLTLVAGYNVKLRKRIIDRWMELEAKPLHLIPQSLPEALRLAADLADQKAQAEAKLAIAAPKADALDRIATFGNGSYCIREAAKMLEWPERKFFQKLQEIHWIYHPPMGGNWLGYADVREKGYVEHKRTQGEKSDGSRWESVQVRITDKGLAKLATLIQAEAA